VLIREVRPIRTALLRLKGRLSESARSILAGKDLTQAILSVAKPGWVRYVILGHTFVRALRAVCLVAGHIEDGALDGDVGRIVWVGACGWRMLRHVVVELEELESNSPSHFDR
jgi:hypothetical protein